jgi:hypothetical protein
VLFIVGRGPAPISDSGKVLQNQAFLEPPVEHNGGAPRHPELPSFKRRRKTKPCAGKFRGGPGPVRILHASASRSRPSRRLRWRFAHLRRILRLDRLRLRGPRGAQDEFVLAAIVQNRRRLALLVTRPPPTRAPCSAERWSCGEGRQRRRIKAGPLITKWPSAHQQQPTFAT